MLKFYEETKSDKTFQTLSGKISWSQINLILSRSKSKQERYFYAKKSLELGWSFRVLDHQMDLHMKQVN